MRIGSSFPEPKNPHRMLATWLSYDDLERLVLASLTTNCVGHTIVYGVSANPQVWWDNAPARHLGFEPRDSSQRWADRIERDEPPADPDDPAQIYQGGTFVRQGPAS